MTSKLSSNILGMDVTTFADGFAKFIVKRTKEELNIAFFEHFKDFIDQYPDIRTLYPQTYSILSHIGDNIYNYNAYLTSLRESFNKDLKSLPDHLPSIIDNHPNYFNNHPDLLVSLKSSFYLSKELYNNTHPGEIIANFPITYFDTILEKANSDKVKSVELFKGVVQTLQLFSEALRETSSNPLDETNYWVSPQKVQELLNNEKAFKIFLGLMQLKNNTSGDSIVYQTTTNFNAFMNCLNQDMKDYKSFQNYITTFTTKTQALSTLLKTYSEKALTDSARLELYYSYYTTTMSLIRFGFDAIKLPYIKNIEEIKNLPPTVIENYFNIADAAGNLVVDINRHRYCSAVNNVVTIYELSFNKNNGNLSEDLHGTLKAKNKDGLSGIIDDLQAKYGSLGLQHIIEQISASEKDYSLTVPPTQNISDNLIKKLYGKEGLKKIASNRNSLSSIKLLIDTNDSTQIEQIKGYLAEYGNQYVNNEMLTSFIKYSTFMANLVDAKSSEEVEKIIEAVALPEGSARIKRESAWNISLNAYCGLYWGSEKIRGVDYGFREINFRNTYGVTAPIGFSFSNGKQHIYPLGSLKKFDGHWSHSIFVSVIDIGALAAYRFDSANDSVSSVPKITLENIISPGIFYSIGIPKTPVSVNLGYQFGPLLRKVEGASNTVQNEKYTRFSVSVCVDLPILNLYNKLK